MRHPDQAPVNAQPERCTSRATPYFVLRAENEHRNHSVLQAHVGLVRGTPHTKVWASRPQDHSPPCRPFRPFFQPPRLAWLQGVSSVQSVSAENQYREPKKGWGLGMPYSGERPLVLLSGSGVGGHVGDA